MVPKDIKGLAVEKYPLIDDHDKFTKLFGLILDHGHVAFDVRTDGLDPLSSNLVGIGVSPVPHKSFYIPLAHPGHIGLTLDDVKDYIGHVCGENYVTIVFHDTVSAMIVLERAGMPIDPTMIHDVMVVQHGLDNGKHKHFTPQDFPLIVKQALDYSIPSLTTIVGTGCPWEQIPVKKASPYSAMMADYIMQMYYDQKDISPSNQHRHEQIDYPMMVVLKQMYMNGIEIDLDYLREMKDAVENKIIKNEAILYKIAGRNISVFEYRNLSNLLFNELKLTPGVGQFVKEGGIYATDAEHLAQIEDQHQIVFVIQSLRRCHHALTKHLNPIIHKTRAGRLHSWYRPLTSSTRIASVEPPMQAIVTTPIEGYKVRRVCVAPDGYKWVEGDYKQIDLRVLAHIIVKLFKDWEYAKIFENGGDPHAITAGSMNNLPPSNVSPDQRRIAKTINFSIIYGITAYGLQRKLQCTEGEANIFLMSYFNAYPSVKKWITFQKAFADKKGYVETPFYKTRRWLDKGQHQIALNHPVQGGSGEIVKAAMIEIDRILYNHPELDTKMIFQGHDAIAFQVPDHAVDRFVRFLGCAMTDPFPYGELAVPLEIEIKVGQNWADLEVYSQRPPPLAVVSSAKI